MENVTNCNLIFHKDIIGWKIKCNKEDSTVFSLGPRYSCQLVVSCDPISSSKEEESQNSSLAPEMFLPICQRLTSEIFLFEKCGAQFSGNFGRDETTRRPRCFVRSFRDKGCVSLVPPPPPGHSAPRWAWVWKHNSGQLQPEDRGHLGCGSCSQTLSLGQGNVEISAKSPEYSVCVSARPID